MRYRGAGGARCSEMRQEAPAFAGATCWGSGWAAFAARVAPAQAGAFALGYGTGRGR